MEGGQNQTQKTTGKLERIVSTTPSHNKTARHMLVSCVSRVVLRIVLCCVVFVLLMFRCAWCSVLPVLVVLKRVKQNGMPRRGKSQMMVRNTKHNKRRHSQAPASAWDLEILWILPYHVCCHVACLSLTLSVLLCVAVVLFVRGHS